MFVERFDGLLLLSRKSGGLRRPLALLVTPLGQFPLYGIGCNSYGCRIALRERAVIDAGTLASGLGVRTGMVLGEPYAIDQIWFEDGAPQEEPCALLHAFGHGRVRVHTGGNVFEFAAKFDQ